MQKKQETWTPAEYQAHLNLLKGRDAQATRLKYGNVPQNVDGMTFDSKKEAEYYGRCKLRVRAGHLLKFEVHKVYKLIVNEIIVGSYEADFVLYHPGGAVTVVDVKSSATETIALFQLKKKLMKAIYGIEIQIVK